MKLRLLILWIGISLSAVVAAEPLNLSEAKEVAINYHDSGAYDYEVASVIKEAMEYLEFRITKNQQIKQPQKLAIVMDIDETSLSNYKDMRTLNFGGTMEQIDQMSLKADDPPIKSSLDFYNYAISHGVAVFFVTGRHESERQSTIKNLNEAGYRGWTHLYMKPNDYQTKTVITYKMAMRRAIIAQGYDIIINIGDQESDLKGGLADMTFKLPNPYYKIR